MATARARLDNSLVIMAPQPASAPYAKISGRLALCSNFMISFPGLGKEGRTEGSREGDFGREGERAT